MKIITGRNLDELVGKKIAFTHIAPFAENITIATEGGCVIVITHEIDYDDGEALRTKILSEFQAIQYIDHQNYVREQLIKLDIFDVDAYKKRKEKEERERDKVLKEWQEERDRSEYERLKEKFENK